MEDKIGKSVPISHSCEVVVICFIANNDSTDWAEMHFFELNSHRTYAKLCYQEKCKFYQSNKMIQIAKIKRKTNESNLKVDSFYWNQTKTKWRLHVFQSVWTNKHQTIIPLNFKSMIYLSFIHLLSFFYIYFRNKREFLYIRCQWTEYELSWKCWHINNLYKNSCNRLWFSLF